MWFLIKIVWKKFQYSLSFLYGLKKNRFKRNFSSFEIFGFGQILLIQIGFLPPPSSEKQNISNLFYHFLLIILHKISSRWSYIWVNIDMRNGVHASIHRNIDIASVILSKVWLNFLPFFEHYDNNGMIIELNWFFF